jgi:hypothetical protein
MPADKPVKTTGTLGWRSGGSGGQHSGVSGPAHLLAAVQNARALAARGDLRGATTVLDDTVEVAVAVLGPDHPEVLSATRLLASLHRDLGELSVARRLLESAIAAGERSLGDADAMMLSLSYDLATLAHELGNRHEARRNFARLARYGPAVLGAEHPQVEAALRYLHEDAGRGVQAGAGPGPVSAPGEAAAADQPPNALQLPGRARAARPPGRAGAVEPPPADRMPAEHAWPEQPPLGTRYPDAVPAAPPVPARSAPPVPDRSPEQPDPSASEPAGARSTDSWPADLDDADLDDADLDDGYLDDGYLEDAYLEDDEAFADRDEEYAEDTSPDPSHLRSAGVEPAVPAAPGAHRPVSAPPGPPLAGPGSAGWPSARSTGPPDVTAPPRYAVERDGPAHGMPRGAERVRTATAGAPAEVTGRGGPARRHEHRRRSRRSRTPVVVVIVVVALALAGGSAAAVIAFVNAAPAPRPTAAPSSPTAASPSTGPAAGAPTNVRLRDEGVSITLSWTDPTNGEVPFIVAGGRADQGYQPLRALGSGQTTYTLNGLNPTLDYCFLVAAVYSADRTVPADPVCTHRRSSPPPSAQPSRSA